jgi:hypothetical protein
MSLPDIVFLSAVCASYGVFMITLGAAAWYCRDRLMEGRQEPILQPARVREPASPDT